MECHNSQNMSELFDYRMVYFKDEIKYILFSNGSNLWYVIGLFTLFKACVSRANSIFTNVSLIISGWVGTTDYAVYGIVTSTFLYCINTKDNICFR